MRILLIFSICATLSAGDWVLPWVANKDGAWASQIAINNHDSVDVSVRMTAVRPSGEQQVVDALLIPSGGQLVADAGAVFDLLGSGTGYAVLVHCDQSDLLTMAAKVASTNSASGDSPALAHGLSQSSASARLVFSFMPFDAGGAAAPVLVNLGDHGVEVQLDAIASDGATIGTAWVQIQPKTPFADVMDNLFPGIDRASYVVARADAPLVGMAFDFNLAREPSAMLAQPSEAPDALDLYPLLMTVETASSLSQAYAFATEDALDFGGDETAKRACPEVMVDLNLTNSESFMTALIDWGSGCTNPFGVYHAGSVEMSMAREGSLQTGGWMNGRLSFDHFVTKYLASDLEIWGETHAEGSTKSSNFTLTGAWHAEGDVPAYPLHGSFESSSFLNVNRNGSGYRAFGNFSVAFNGYDYGEVRAMVDASDPLVYAFGECPWPTQGRLEIEIYYGYPVTGSLDFGTGDCQTARLEISGQTTELYLPGIYL